MERLTTTEYRTISQISGPLVFIKNVKGCAYGAMVEVLLPDGTVRHGQMIDASEGVSIIQVFEETIGLELKKTRIRLKEEGLALDLSREILGRVFDGRARPQDGLPALFPEKRVLISASAINPYSRDNPSEFIQTGVSAIDGLNTLVRGQKLPIFSLAGLPANRIACQIAKQAKVRKTEDFSVVFCGMGIPQREADYFLEDFRTSGSMYRTVVFLNRASDPPIERLLTPRYALTCAEYLAFELDMHVLVILTDMTNYSEALREVSAARREVPGRRGYQIGR